jgi:hypothetical protein
MTNKTIQMWGFLLVAVSIFFAGVHWYQQMPTVNEVNNKTALEIEREMHPFLTGIIANLDASYTVESGLCVESPSDDPINTQQITKCYTANEDTECVSLNLWQAQAGSLEKLSHKDAIIAENYSVHTYNCFSTGDSLPCIHERYIIQTENDENIVGQITYPPEIQPGMLYADWHKQALEDIDYFKKLIDVPTTPEYSDVPLKIDPNSDVCKQQPEEIELPTGRVVMQSPVAEMYKLSGDDYHDFAGRFTAAACDKDVSDVLTDVKVMIADDASIELRNTLDVHFDCLDEGGGAQTCNRWYEPGKLYTDSVMNLRQWADEIIATDCIECE